MAVKRVTFTDTLAKELIALENIHGQDPDTGRGLTENSLDTYISQYTPRLFGSPFQLINSVDKRFDEINPYLGNNYLRNFTLNSPILHVKPGMPIYTGGGSASRLIKIISDAFMGGNDDINRYPQTKGLLMSLASNTIFSSGDKLQRRMYGFRETYYTYMQYVNYMCRSMAVFLNLINTENNDPGVVKKYTTNSGKYPVGTKIETDTKITPFKTLDWSRYRWIASSKVKKPSEYLAELGQSTYLGAAFSSLAGSVGATASAVGDVVSGLKDMLFSMSAEDMGNYVVQRLYGSESSIGSTGGNVMDAFRNALTNAGNRLSDQATANQSYFDNADATSLLDVMQDKVQSVMFMVEPTSFEENLRNDTTTSAIESALDSLHSSIGKEIAFITRSQTDFGLLDNVTEFLGDTIETASTSLAKLTEGLTGGFMTNLFHGAIKSLKGQKMIYPEIYDKSSSETNYNYTVSLSTPYGDDYNYYMEIIVPLMHLIGLAAPRMITSNAVASPFLVQTWIPGQSTCQLGIISNMQIIKNPNARHVSVHGFPLEVKVQFTVRELYNSMSISPANDPASFLYNETLNDYMANLGGLAPSVNTYKQQRINMFSNLEDYFSTGEMVEDVINSAVEGFEEFWNPFISNG